MRFASMMFALSVCLSSFAATANAAPETYTFSRITNTASTDVGSQLRVQVGSFLPALNSNNRVYFKFLNLGPVASSITQVYFDDRSNPNDVLIDLESDQITYSTGVEFVEDTNPNSNLPSGTNILFKKSAGFAAEADSPVSQNGVDPSSEWLQLVFTLKTGKTLADVISSLNAGLVAPPNNLSGQDKQNYDHPGLRIGLHVQAIDKTSTFSGNSDSFVNSKYTPPPPGPTTVPEPTSGLVCLLLGASGLIGRRLRKRA